MEGKIGVRPPPIRKDTRSPDDKPLLNKGLISLRERRLLFDVEIAVGDTGKVFGAHRVVLASASPYWGGCSLPPSERLVREVYL